jgi:hypothetical protein
LLAVSLLWPKNKRYPILGDFTTKEALSVQIDTLRLNGQATTEMIETLLAMVSTV